MTSDSTARIEREVEVHRAEIERTLDALRTKFSAGQIIDSVSRTLSNAGGQGNDFLQGLGQQVKQNPVPAALIGAGIAWLVVNRGQGKPDPHAVRHGGDAARPIPFDYDEYAADERENGVPYAVAKLRRGEYDLTDHGTAQHGTAYDPSQFATDEDARGLDYALGRLKSGAYSKSGPSEGSKYYDRARFAADEAAHGINYAGERLKAGAYKVSGAAAGASQAVYDKARVATDELRHGAQFVSDQLRAGAYSVTQAAQSAYEGARDAVSDAATSTQEVGRRAQRATADFITEQPLVAGLVSLAVGAAIGGLLPSTRKEDELIGPHRDAARDEILSYAADKTEKVERVADKAIEAAKEGAREEDLVPDASDKAQPEADKKPTKKPSRK